MSRRIVLVVLCCLVTCASVLASGGASHSDDTSPPLAFRIQVEKGEYWSPDWVLITWELQNVSNRPVYVCQWPGPAFSHSWEYPEGVFQGVVPGYPHTQKLSRKFFVELKPGEAILGSTRYQIPTSPTPSVNVHGTYRSGQAGSEYRINAWQGEIDADVVEVEVAKPPPPAPDAKDGSSQ